MRLAGGKGCEDRTPTVPAFTNLLGAIGALQGRLPATPPAPAPSDPIFNQTAFDALAKQAKADIARVADPKAAADDAGRLKSIQDQENSLTSQLAALGNTLTNVQKDFLTYYQNVLLATHAVPEPTMEDGGLTAMIGTIYDPQSNQANVPIHYAKFLGRQVVFSVNAVNNLTTAVTSITTATARVSIATVTVLYADPRLEASAGAMVSFVHNRSFVNQTLADGDIAIAQTKTDPEVVPMVALHYRVGDDFDWIGHRRAAWYGTGWVGLNPYSTVPEYGGGTDVCVAIDHAELSLQPGSSDGADRGRNRGPADLQPDGNRDSSGVHAGASCAGYEDSGPERICHRADGAHPDELCGRAGRGEPVGNLRRRIELN